MRAQPLDELIASCKAMARTIVGRQDQPSIVVAPYRFNPLGAHIDHQGGSVLARTLDQYTIICFWPRQDTLCSVCSNLSDDRWQRATFSAGQLDDQYGWDAMARASVAAFAKDHTLSCGFDAAVFGTLVSGGLSSSASVILGYLSVLTAVNDLSLTQRECVDLVRRVENDYRGLNNGIQDQMSIVYAKENHIALLDVVSGNAISVADPPAMAQCEFMMFYSGVSRNLVTGSNFNQRVSECQQAARLLHPEAQHLGEVPGHLRTNVALAALPDGLGKRAKHVYTEMQRVEQGCAAWSAGDMERFGELMNESCQSSINQYESGSPWLIELHRIASGVQGVYGNRFSGGGYGGCLFMLIEAQAAEQVACELRDQYLCLYPDLHSRVRVKLARSEQSVRTLHHD